MEVALSRAAPPFVPDRFEKKKIVPDRAGA